MVAGRVPSMLGAMAVALADLVIPPAAAAETPGALVCPAAAVAVAAAVRLYEQA